MKELMSFILSPFVFCVLLFLFCCIKIGLYQCHRQAEIYNKLCQPAIKATASDAIWMNLNVGNCNPKQKK